MKTGNPEYVLKRRFGIYVIYRMEYTENGGSGSPVFRSPCFEKAREKLYELNNWKKKF